ncbi:MAG: hypothetical protein K2N85_06025 [Lachnospiraceae bacterium]|nr:hypothetical protein [Lachnospiraceae bacterium]
MSRNEKIRMGIYVLTGIVLIAVVAVLSVAVLNKRASKNVQAQAVSPSYTDENGGEYIAAFLKGMTDSTITVDIAEFITDDDTERIKELNLTGEDIPDGYYIYNPDEETVTWKLDGQTIYTFIDWNGDFTGSDYPEEYTTTDAAEFQRYIGTYEDSQPGMPLFFRIEDGVVKNILEKQIA